MCLLLDLQVPTSPDNPKPYPAPYLIPKLLETHTDLAILVISMCQQGALFQTMMEAGASGYLLKDDQATIRELPSVIRTGANQGIYLSTQAFRRRL